MGFPESDLALTGRNEILRSSQKWGVTNPSDCVLTDFDEGLVVFHRPSGQTHVLNALAAEAFTALAEAALTRDQLTRHLMEASESGAAQEMAAAAEEIIDRFELLGLVDRVDE